MRFLSVFVAVMAVSLTARSVVPENDYRTTLNSLLYELKHSYVEALQSDSLLIDNQERRQKLAEMVKAADEVALILYTQRQDFAFDMAFALEEVRDVYDTFKEQARLSDKYLIASRSGLRRYILLGETLRDMYNNHPVDSLVHADSLLKELPPFEPLEELNPEKKALLDSCLHYTEILTDLYGGSVMMALQDSVYFAETDRRLSQAYEFAQANYANTQRSIFMGGNVGIIHIIKDWDSHIEQVKRDLQNRFDDKVTKYENGNIVVNKHPWGGRNSLRHAALALLALLVSFLLAGFVNSLLFHFFPKEGFRKYRPILTSILAIIFFVLALFLFRMDRSSPYWRMAYRLISQFLWLMLAIFVSLLIRVRGDQARASRNLYIPTLLLCFMAILLRAIFLPASIVPIIFPPALIIFIIWQSAFNVHYRSQAIRSDLMYMWVSVGVMTAACILSLIGYSMIGVLLITFWTFQLALMHTITTFYYLIKRYYEGRLSQRKARYHEENPFLPLEDKNAFIEVTWSYDLIRMVVIPLAIIFSLLASMKLTSLAYQLSLTGTDFMRHHIFNEGWLNNLTPLNTLVIIALFYVFRYLIYLVKGLSRVIRLRGIIERRGEKAIPLKESDVNLSLANVVYSLVGWLIYLGIVFSVLDMDSRAITTITTGLMAGIGFAMKDLINNFFYGVQLMAGRIRVGDKISCDGIRGIVKQVSYQTTQVEDEDGSLIAFTNTDLFTKKFRNLNRGRNYELLKIPVCVRYGTDVEFARKVILEALEPLRTKDKEGRNVVDPNFPIDVRFSGFGDSSVDLIVALYSTVDTHYTFPARALEAIYNAFYANGIESPFPQRDLYLKTIPEKTGLENTKPFEK